jgi:O-antigen/teichoic acid export membrane protein
MATPMLISSSLFLVISWSDTLMLGYYLTEDRVGVYRIVFKIATLITFAQFALNTVVAPMVSALHEKGTALDELTTKVARLNLLTAGPIFIGIVLLGPWLISMFGVSTASSAYPWLLILAFGQLINAFAGPGLNILNMTGYEKSARNTMLVVVVLNFLLNLLFIPAFGPLGAAISTTLTMVGWNVWAALLVYKYHGVVAVPFLTHIKK